MSFVPQRVHSRLPMSSFPSSCAITTTGGGGSPLPCTTLVTFVLLVVTALSSMSPFPLLITHHRVPQLTPNCSLTFFATHLRATTTANASLLPPTCRLIVGLFFTESRHTFLLCGWVMASTVSLLSFSFVRRHSSSKLYRSSCCPLRQGCIP